MKKFHEVGRKEFDKRLRQLHLAIGGYLFAGLSVRTVLPYLFKCVSYLWANSDYSKLIIVDDEKVSSVCDGNK